MPFEGLFKLVRIAGGPTGVNLMIAYIGLGIAAFGLIVGVWRLLAAMALFFEQLLHHGFNLFDPATASTPSAFQWGRFTRHVFWGLFFVFVIGVGGV